jgi:catechol-2,3-dioxygenase
MQLTLSKKDEDNMESITFTNTAAPDTKPDRSEMTGLGHVGMYARNLDSIAEFYRDVMGMQIVGGSDASHPLGASAFLSSRPREESHHEVAMFSDRHLAHLAFQVRSLAALKQFYQKIVGRGIPIRFQFLHGVSFAFYFQDPEGNLIEVFWPTGLEYPQPYAQETHLTRTEEELMQELKALTEQKDSASPSLQKV